jgi:homoserine O-acetyltransferase
MATLRETTLVARALESRSRTPLRLASNPLSRSRKNTRSPLLPKRSIHSQDALKAQAAITEGKDNLFRPSASSNPALSFPCLEAQEAKTAQLHNNASHSGPEPSYTTGKHLWYRSREPLLLDWGGILPQFDIAYETWGDLNVDKNNAILLHTGLSASSHAHSTDINPKPGWWEKFIGPGAPLDTDKYFVICTNVIGGCFGSTGPSSIDPSDGRRYATRFPIVTMEDMVRAQFRLLDGLKIGKLYASVGASMGGMQSLAAGALFPDRVEKIVSISGCARSHPYSIAMRHTQRQVLMMDPNWNRGFYYDPGQVPPHSGMKLAREIATVTYRSGPEWENRFGRRRVDSSRQPALCPDFLVETYLDHAGEKFSLEYDPNSLLYVSKAMDLFDLGKGNMANTVDRRRQKEAAVSTNGTPTTDRRGDLACSLTLPERDYEEQPQPASLDQKQVDNNPGPPQDLVDGLAGLRTHPTLVMGVASDILFPAWQQREIAETLKANGNDQVKHVELGEDVSLFGHDTFLLDLEHIGGNVSKFLG